MGTCDACEFMFCIRCGQDYHGNNTVVKCNMSDEQRQEMIRMHREEEARLRAKEKTSEGKKSKKTENEAKKQNKKESKKEEVKKERTVPIRTERSYVAEEFPLDGIQIQCNSCKHFLVKKGEAWENESWSTFGRHEQFSYFNCNCRGFVRIPNKEIEKWIDKALKKDKDGLEIVKLDRKPYVRYYLPKRALQ